MIMKYQIYLKNILNGYHIIIYTFIKWKYILCIIVLYILLVSIHLKYLDFLNLKLKGLIICVNIFLTNKIVYLKIHLLHV